MKKYWYCLLLPVLLTACGRESASIGIIGGADGPTAIMVATTGVTSLNWLEIGVGVLILVGVFVFFWLREKKK